MTASPRDQRKATQRAAFVCPGSFSGVRCATCDLIGDQMAEHDAWVAELKAAAEAVLDRERATRAKIAEIGGGK